MSDGRQKREMDPVVSRDLRIISHGFEQLCRDDNTKHDRFVQRRINQEAHSRRASRAIKFLRTHRQCEAFILHTANNFYKKKTHGEIR